MFSNFPTHLFQISGEELLGTEMTLPTLKLADDQNKQKSFMNLINFLSPYFWRKPETILEFEDEELQPINLRINQAPNNVHFTDLLNDLGCLLKNETKSTGYIVYIKENDEIFICPRSVKYYFKERQSWPLDGNTIACEVIRTKKFLNVSTSRCNLKFPNFQAIPELSASNVLTVPILDYKNECYGAVEVYREDGINYSMDNVKKMKFMVRWVAESMRQNKRTVLIERCNNINLKLLDILQKNINEEFNRDYDLFLLKVVYLARSSFDVESANFFVYGDNELNKECSTDNSFRNDFNRKKLRLMKELQLAYLAFSSTNLINLSDVYNDPKYNREVDKNTGKIIRSCLEVPIYGAAKDDILGVLQIFNKMREKNFNDIDEYMIMAFSRYSSIWLQYKQKRLSLYIQKYYNITYKNLTYQITTTRRNFTDYFDRNEPFHPSHDFKSFSFYPQVPTPAEIAKLIYFIFYSKCIKYISSKSALYLFVYAVRKCYKPEPYTNFVTAFMHLHTTFCIILYYPNYFDALEIFSLLLTAFCMNIDSNGKSIEYMNLIDDPILKIYAKNPLESHQFSLMTIILAATDLLKCSVDEKTRLFSLIEENLLGKNLKMHLRHRLELKQILDKNNFSLENKNHSFLLRNLIIAVANFSTHAKPLKVANIFGDQLIKEFIKLETKLQKELKNDEKINPAEQRYKFEKIHCHFMEYIGLPAFELLKKIFPIVQIMYDRYLEHINFQKKMFSSKNTTESNSSEPIDPEKARNEKKYKKTE